MPSSWCSTILVGLALAGCTGAIVETVGSESSAGDPSGAGSSPLGDGRIAARVWRLTPEQYNAEVQRLLPGAPAADIPSGSGEHNFTNVADGARIDLGNASQFNDAARLIGSWAATQGASAARCDAFGTPQCVETFLGWFPEAAYRRPLSDAERAELRAVYDDVSQEYGATWAFSALVRAVLLSPQFLYRTELGGAGEDVVELEPYEIASLLSFSLTDAGPDEELLSDAEAGTLRDPDVREAHVRRLMGRSSAVWQRFFWEWLKMSTLESQGNETELDPALVEQLEAEYRAFVANVVVESRGTLHDLLTASYTWGSADVASYYGASHAGSGVQRIELDPTQRGGIFTLGAWLVAHGKKGRDNVVRRGMAIYIDAMCSNITPLNIDLEAAMRELVGEEATVKEIVEIRSTDRTCGGCHRLADPAGLAFETYAGDGTWQTTYPDGKPVEATVALEGLGSFESAPEFSAALAADRQFQECFVQRFGHFLMGAEVGAANKERVTRDAYDALVDSGGSFEELLVALVRDPAFIERSKQP